MNEKEVRDDAEDEINLISFGSCYNLSKEVEKIEEGEVEGPCTSYSH